MGIFSTVTFFMSSGWRRREVADRFYSSKLQLWTQIGEEQAYRLRISQAALLSYRLDLGIPLFPEELYYFQFEVSLHDNLTVLRTAAYAAFTFQ
ncbi:hypothetical protein JN06_01402 [Bacteroides zoogleoformans]|nr:hypothetical protein JN06_01402 [Bacteroides zoogleoformans]